MVIQEVINENHNGALMDCSPKVQHHQTTAQVLVKASVLGRKARNPEAIIYTCSLPEVDVHIWAGSNI